MTKDIKTEKDLLKLYNDFEDKGDLTDYEQGVYHTLEAIIEYGDEQFIQDFVENCVKIYNKNHTEQKQEVKND